MAQLRQDLDTAPLPAERFSKCADEARKFAEKHERALTNGRSREAQQSFNAELVRLIAAGRLRK